MSLRYCEPDELDDDTATAAAYRRWLGGEMSAWDRVNDRPFDLEATGR